MLKTVKSRSNR